MLESFATISRKDLSIRMHSFTHEDDYDFSKYGDLLYEEPFMYYSKVKVFRLLKPALSVQDFHIFIVDDEGYLQSRSDYEIAWDDVEAYPNLEGLKAMLRFHIEIEVYNLMSLGLQERDE